MVLCVPVKVIIQLGNCNFIICLLLLLAISFSEKLLVSLFVLEIALTMEFVSPLTLVTAT